MRRFGRFSKAIGTAMRGARVNKDQPGPTGIARPMMAGRTGAQAGFVGNLSGGNAAAARMRSQARANARAQLAARQAAPPPAAPAPAPVAAQPIQMTQPTGPQMMTGHDTYKDGGVIKGKKAGKSSSNCAPRDYGKKR
jgi:hypothetical protein